MGALQSVEYQQQVEVECVDIHGGRPSVRQNRVRCYFLTGVHGKIRLFDGRNPGLIAPSRNLKELQNRLPETPVAGQLAPSTN